MIYYLFRRCFIRTADGHIGLGPPGTKTGDVMWILLTCIHPVILRPVLDSRNHHEWLLVGVCYIHGLMGGEAIYKHKHAARYKPLQHHVADDQLIDNRTATLLDLKPGKMMTDPQKLLEEAGFRVENYQREPHRLIVLPETLSWNHSARVYFGLGNGLWTSLRTKSAVHKGLC